MTEENKQVVEARAVARYVRISPRKVRVVIDLIRGKNVDKARTILAFSDRNAAETILKVLNSAIANAENNFGMRADDLYVKTCYVDEGPTLKRIRPRAKGSAARILKRSSHITVVVAPRKEA
ncbi:50S ribosomal protein L22 [bacterium]|jgi:large subunit ribosomal protein L22|nr:50S ribosomal protein L22 [bacterium]